MASCKLSHLLVYVCTIFYKRFFFPFVISMFKFFFCSRHVFSETKLIPRKDSFFLKLSFVSDDNAEDLSWKTASEVSANSREKNFKSNKLNRRKKNGLTATSEWIYCSLNVQSRFNEYNVSSSFFFTFSREYCSVLIVIANFNFVFVHDC